MFVLVVGGGKVGYYLSKELVQAGHEVVLLEKDKARAEQIADEIGSIVIAHDGCEGKYLGEAGANRADIVAAVTGDDEDNLVICQMAKHHFDVRRTIARVNNPANEALFKHLGVDELISPTRMILGSIEQDIPVNELLHLAALGSGELELIEAHRRLYPKGGMGAHVLGYVGEVSESELKLKDFAKFSAGDTVGKFGLERQYNTQLTGVDGQRRVVVDSRGREHENLDKKEAVPGENLQLTVDLDLQAVAELGLEGKRGDAIAIYSPEFASKQTSTNCVGSMDATHQAKSEDSSEARAMTPRLNKTRSSLYHLI